MARLTDAQADALVRALTRESGVYAVTSTVPSDPGAWHPAEGVQSPPRISGDTDAHRLRAFARDAAQTDEIGRTITLDLAAYLRRPVRCSLGRATPAMATGWRFGADVDGGAVWIDLDVRLASAFGDAMIGGDGGAPIGRGRKVRALATIVVRRMLDAIAGGANIAIKGPVDALTAPEGLGLPVAAGLCAVGVEEYPWAFGVVTRTIAPPSIPSPKDDLAAQPADTPAVQAEGPEETLRIAIDALDARLAELTYGRAVARPSRIERIEGADVAGFPAAALGLALTAGGNGAVIAFADATAVAGIASAAAGARPLVAGAQGELALAATEAVVRDALVRAALKLPALGDEGRRVVRLSDDPLTARTPHHAVDVEVSIDGAAGMLRVLVPSWMLAHREKRNR